MRSQVDEFEEALLQELRDDGVSELAIPRLLYLLREAEEGFRAPLDPEELLETLEFLRRVYFQNWVVSLPQRDEGGEGDQGQSLYPPKSVRALLLLALQTYKERPPRSPSPLERIFRLRYLWTYQALRSFFLDLEALLALVEDHEASDLVTSLRVLSTEVSCVPEEAHTED